MSYLMQPHPIFLLLILPVWVFLLRLLSGLFQIDVPSYRRATVNVVLTGVISFFVYDTSGYAFLNMFGGDFVEMPPDYGYWGWLCEPLALKWEVLGLVPGIRYLPLVFALCAAGTMEVLTLLVPFRTGLFLCLTHWSANLALLALVGFLQSLILGDRPADWELFASADRPKLQLKARPGFDPETLKGIVATLTPKTDLDTHDTGEKKSPAKDQSTQEEERPAEDHAAPLLTFLARFDPHLEAIKRSSAPVVSRMPSVEKFLNMGGWWLILAVLAMLSACWLTTMIMRVRRLVPQMIATVRRQQTARHK